MNSLLVLAYASITVTALAYPGPAPTQPGNVKLAVNGRSAVPTALARRSDPVQLFRRQDDRTCGYIDQNFEKPITCSAGQYCAFDPDPSSKVFGCCSGPISDCLLKTTCYSSADLESSCDSDCQSYTENAICNYGTRTMCVVYLSTYDGTLLSAFGCGPEAFTSYVDGIYTNGPSSASSIIVQVITSVLAVPVSTSSASSLPFSSSSSSSASSTPSPTPTPSAPPVQVPAPKAKTPIAPIIGGVVGGLVMITVAIIAAIFLIRRKRSQPSPATSGVAEYVQPQAQPYQESYVKQPISSGMSFPPMSPPMSPAPPYGTLHAYHATPPLPHDIVEAP